MQRRRLFALAQDGSGGWFSWLLPRTAQAPTTVQSAATTEVSRSLRTFQHVCHFLLATGAPQFVLRCDQETPPVPMATTDDPAPPKKKLKTVRCIHIDASPIRPQSL
jgi:hypothetical protein